MPRIYVYVSHRNGVPDDSGVELRAAARKIAPNQEPTAVVTGWGPSLDAAAESLIAHYPTVWKIARQELAYPNAELVRQALVAVLPPGCILLAAHDHFGVDLSPGLSVKLNAAYVPDVVGVESVSASSLLLVRQEIGGQVSTHVRCDLTSGAVLNIRSGAFAAPAASSVRGAAIDKSHEAGALQARRRYIRTVTADAGDIDITKYKLLVSVGRGIGEQDNIALAEALAEALGGAVSCSRPVVDAKWLEKSRQVGSSGKTVKPRVYLACGISGSFQHLAGIKSNPFIVAINKNPKAPIFQVADIGIIDDILEFLPALTAQAQRGLAAKGGGAR